jgi:hypothetical protein
LLRAMIEELHQNLQTLVAGQFFVKIEVRFFSLREATKFSRCFLHAVTISLAVTAPERI